MDDEPLALWGYGLVIAGGVFVLAATLAGVLLRTLWIAGFELDDGLASRLLDPFVGHGLAPLLVMAWGLAAGGAVLASGLMLRPNRDGHAIVPAVVAIAAAIASLPVTGGFGIGAPLTIVGAGLALAERAR